MALKNPALWQKVGKALIFVARTILFIKKKKDERTPSK